ncbi:hypothetical protein BGZ72_000143, partial [Mortierella alpina]
MTGSSINFDIRDPILRSIAQELHSTLNQDGIHRAANASVHSSKDYDFQLHSLLTRPRNCTTLFPPSVLKKRHQKVTLQERLILISVKPVEDSSGSSSSSDTIDSNCTTSLDKPVGPAVTSSAVLVAGLEVLEYMLTPTTDAASDNSASDKNINHSSGSPRDGPVRQERIVYIAKVDTSGCWPLPGLDTQSLKSPAQALVKGYLRAVQSQGYESRSGNLAAAEDMSSLSLSDKDKVHIQDQDQGQDQDQDQKSVTKTSLYVFARAQPQYLFAESAKNIGKRVLDDRGLVRWWKNMITSAYSVPPSSSTSSSSSSLPSKAHGWWLIPGIETERQAMNVIQSKSPSRTSIDSTGHPQSLAPLSLQYGYSDKDSTEMAHTLIPQFPDDPKSRMMKSPSCQGGFVDIKTFWELAAIGEESGAGKITGFFKVVQEDEIPERTSFESEAKTVSSAPTTATTTTTATTATFLTGTTGDYTRAINFLLELNFSTLDRAQASTQQWFDRLEVWITKATLKNAADIDTKTSEAVDDAPVADSEGGLPQETNDKKSETTTTTSTPPTHRRSSSASPLWIQQGSVRIRLLQTQDPSAGHTSGSGSAPAEMTAGPVVHTLNAGLIKRKPQQQQQTSPLSIPIAASSAAPTVNVLSVNLIKRKPTPGGVETPTVNVLGSNVIKRKPAATLATTTTSPTTAEAVVISTAPETTSTSSAPSEPSVNVLDSNLIKKRKINP